MEKLKIGDSVSLNAGSESMTIAQIKDAYAICVWHDKEGHHQEQKYPLDALRNNNGVLGVYKSN